LFPMSAFHPNVDVPMPKWLAKSGPSATGKGGDANPKGLAVP
jgi:hypothetical protein